VEKAKGLQEKGNGASSGRRQGSRRKKDEASPSEPDGSGGGSIIVFFFGKMKGLFNLERSENVPSSILKHKTGEEINPYLLGYAAP